MGFGHNGPAGFSTRGESREDKGFSGGPLEQRILLVEKEESKGGGLLGLLGLAPARPPSPPPSEDVLQCREGHALQPSFRARHFCDVCGTEGTHYRCAKGCDYDACRKCYLAHAKAAAANRGGAAAANYSTIMAEDVWDPPGRFPNDSLRCTITAAFVMALSLGLFVAGFNLALGMGIFDAPRATVDLAVTPNSSLLPLAHKLAAAPPTDPAGVLAVAPASHWVAPAHGSLPLWGAAAGDGEAFLPHTRLRPE